MDADINDIWDLPLETPVHHIPVNNSDGDGPTSPPRASNPPLFLPSDDEDDTVTTNNHTAPQNADIDALFEGLDDINDSFQELAPALDLDALRREADARNARAVRAEIGANIPAAELSAPAKAKGGRGGALDGIDGDGEEDGKKRRKPVPKLDETRLLGKDGLPQLLKDTKNFKPKGKGHEVIIIIILLLPPTSPCSVDMRTNAMAIRRWTWIAYSKCINSGPTNYILKLDSRRR
jgi:replication fork protection complex subunit Csm3/Swi3